MSPRVPPGTCGGSPRRRTAAQPARPTSAGGKRKDGMVSAAPRIVIAAGGTAGHVVPALAVADALRAEGAEVVFIGGDRAEAELVPAAGYRLHSPPGRGPSRSHPLRPLPALGLAPGAGPRARRLLQPVRAGAMLGGGRYFSGPRR